MDPSLQISPSHISPAGALSGQGSPLPSDNSSPNTAVTMAPAVPPIPPLYIDNLAREFGLGDRDRLKLRGLVQVVTGIGGGLGQGALAAHLYEVAVILSEAAERRRQEQERAFTGDMHPSDEGFTLTVNQKANVRGITQDVIHEATRTVFATMHADVLVVLKDRKQALDLDNIFGVPIREKKLVSTLKRACSSIRDSIDPATFVALDKFTYSLASKYKLGGVVGDLSDLFTIHAVLLRRFAFDHPDLLWFDEPMEEDDSESSSPPQKRKRTAKQGGRIPAGKDFWSMVDIYLKDEVAKRGRSFKDARWKPYIDQLIADDNSHFEGMTPGTPVTALMLHDPVAASTSSTSGTAQFGGAFNFSNTNSDGLWTFGNTAA
ncbi:hypothetical protein B0H13DRAFT_2581153 [Mycena leptocephala]|nr:hypothetical protein B0H13DRAFT_2581153 [Mycena leptocephala]